VWSCEDASTHFGRRPVGGPPPRNVSGRGNMLKKGACASPPLRNLILIYLCSVQLASGLGHTGIVLVFSVYALLLSSVLWPLFGKDSLCVRLLTVLYDYMHNSRYL
jgi:hypothetical protein